MEIDHVFDVFVEIFLISLFEMVDEVGKFVLVVAWLVFYQPISFGAD